MHNDYDYSLLAESHQQEFKNSAISDDIAALNFKSFDGTDENDLADVFDLLVPDSKANSNRTAPNKSERDLAHHYMRSGGWIFESQEGVSVKLNEPRTKTDEDRNLKTTKYKSVRGTGNQQLFIPHVSVKSSKGIAERFSLTIPTHSDAKDEDANPSFWAYFTANKSPIIITEGAKKLAH